MAATGAKLAVAGQITLMFALTTLPTPLYRDYAKAFGFSVLALTLIYATYVAGTLSTLFFLGRVSDRLGRRRVSIVALCLAIAASGVFLFAANMGMLFAARLLTGIAAGLSSGTATAWLRDLHARQEERSAALRTVAVNIFALGLGPVSSGLLAEFAPYPLRTPYAAFIALLALGLIAVTRTHETVGNRKRIDEISLKPRVGVPRSLRAQFLAPGVISFVIFALVGRDLGIRRARHRECHIRRRDRIPGRCRRGIRDSQPVAPGHLIGALRSIRRRPAGERGFDATFVTAGCPAI